MRDLDLALIGNGRIGALLNGQGAVVWACFPRFDGDPQFCALLDNEPDATADGVWSAELVDQVRVTQEYVPNTAVLVTQLHDSAGGIVEITDCAPRFMQHGRLFQPMTVVRVLRRISGNPRIVMRLRPRAGYGGIKLQRVTGSNTFAIRVAK